MVAAVGRMIYIVQANGKRIGQANKDKKKSKKEKEAELIYFAQVRCPPTYMYLTLLCVRVFTFLPSFLSFCLCICLSVSEASLL